MNTPSDPLDPLFRRLETETSSTPGETAATDPLEVVRRLELGDAVQDASLRRALADVADAVAHAEPRSPLSASLRKAVVAAYGTQVAAAPRVGAAPPRPALQPAQAAAEREAPARRWGHVYRVAALLLVALGVGLFLASRGEARAALWVAGVDRLALDGSQREVGSSRMLPVGTAFSGLDREFVMLTLESGGRLVLGPGDEATIVGVPHEGGHEGRVALISGCIRADASRGAAEIDLGDGRPLSLLAGRAVIRRVADGVVVTTDASAAVRLGPEPTTWRGAHALRVPSRGAVRAHEGRDDARAFEPLERFQPSRSLASVNAPSAPAPLFNVCLVAPRQWRVVAGTFERRGRSLRVDPRVPHALLAWAPDAAFRSADTIHLRLRGGPAFVRARIDGVERVALASDGRPTHVHLPESWFERLAGKELELEFSWPDASETAQPIYLDEATFMQLGSRPVEQGTWLDHESVPPPSPNGESDESR